MFKIIFAILGLVTFGPIGAVAGLFLGSSVDRYRDYGPGGINPLTKERRQKVFLETVFSLLGKLAKSDGRISEDEIAHAEAIIAQLGIAGINRTEAIRLFKEGAKPETDTDRVLDKFISVCGSTKDLKKILLSYLITMALADSILHNNETSMLHQVAARLGYSKSAFDRLLEMIKNQSHFGASNTNDASDLKNAYRALGLDENASDQELKRAYRRLMSQNHPDKLMGQGVPEDMIKVATEKSKEIQTAYDLIKKNRENS